MVRWLALMLSAVTPVVHSFAAYGVAHRPAALRISRPPQAVAVALPLQGSAQPPIEVLYDGQCMVSRARRSAARAARHTHPRVAARPLQVCLSNKAILSFFDFRKQKRINFVNIRDKGYNPSAHGNVQYEDAMRHLHVVDGSSVRARALTASQREHRCTLQRSCGPNVALFSPLF